MGERHEFIPEKGGELRGPNYANAWIMGKYRGGVC